MLSPVVVVALVAAAYLLGRFPTALLVGARIGHDPTHEGSGNPGATNVARIGGARAGVVVLAGDAAKGALSAAVGLGIGDRALGVGMGLAAVVGHVWPVTRKGGKGVATAAGAVAVLQPVVATIAIVAFALVVVATRVVALASITAAVVVAVLVAVRGAAGWEAAAFAALAAIIVVRHRGNLEQLRRRADTD